MGEMKVKSLKILSSTYLTEFVYRVYINERVFGGGIYFYIIVYDTVKH